MELDDIVRLACTSKKAHECVQRAMTYEQLVDKALVKTAQLDQKMEDLETILPGMIIRVLMANAVEAERLTQRYGSKVYYEVTERKPCGGIISTSWKVPIYGAFAVSVDFLKQRFL